MKREQGKRSATKKSFEGVCVKSVCVGGGKEGGGGGGGVFVGLHFYIAKFCYVVIATPLISKYAHDFDSIFSHNFSDQ